MQTSFMRRRGFTADAIELQAALSRLQVIEESANHPSAHCCIPTRLPKRTAAMVWPACYALTMQTRCTAMPN